MEIVGRVTANAMVSSTKNEKQVVNFSIAVNEAYKPKGSSEVKKITTYFRCAYWVNPGIAHYLTKGTLVQLNGRVGIDAYINAAGEAKANLTFRVSTIKLHGSGNSSKLIVSPDAPVPAEATEDLPF